MPCLQLTLESDLTSTKQLSEFLEQFGAISISLMALSDEKIFAQTLEKDPILWQKNRIIALLHEDTDLDILLVCLRNRVGDGKTRWEFMIGCMYFTVHMV